VTEPVIKFLTVRTDEEQKRLSKIKAIRDSRKKVSAQPAAAAEESAGVPATETPATA
jgi:small subunit ribosomal protein S6